jgi:DMSO/TMAO reductase YedYZ molybdopterin-dependent catalytic subunit
MKIYNPFKKANKPITVAGIFSETEVELANRNSGMPLESLEYDLTPIGQHYLLTHFDIPHLNRAEHIVSFSGDLANPYSLCYDEIISLPKETIPVTLECAGNGRTNIDPRNFSMPWKYGAVGTSEWTGTRLRPLLKEACLNPDVVEVSFTGADRGYDSGHEHNFARSLTLAQIEELDVLLVYQMNGIPLLPQHGAPLRIIVPGWYGMASVKWLTEIKALSKPFDGYQQIGTYRFRQRRDEVGEPITEMRVKSLMKPPGIPDWTSRKRSVSPGLIPLTGRAWSGGGKKITKVEVLINNKWIEAKLENQDSKYSWIKWILNWSAKPGHHILSCRATDEMGASQPENPIFDVGGFANNSIQEIEVFVSDY